MVPTLERFATRRAGLVISLVLLGVSIYSAESATRNPWNSSWLFQQMEQAGLIDYSDPPPTFPFKRSLHTWFATLPNENADTAWIEFTAAGSSVRVGSTRSDTLRLYSVKRKMIDNDLVQTIKVVWNEGRTDESSATFDLDVLAFEEGKTLAAQIPADSVTESDFSRFDLLTLLRGIPTDRAFIVAANNNAAPRATTSHSAGVTIVEQSGFEVLSSDWFSMFAGDYSEATVFVGDDRRRNLVTATQTSVWQ